MPPTSGPATITIRPATTADAGEVLTLQRAAWIVEAQAHDTPFLPPLTQTLADVRADLERQTGLVAVDGHRMVGIVRADAADGVWRIGRLGVAPDRQGEGIGSRLLSAIEAAAPADTARFALFTGPRSDGNVRFYESHGYVRVPSGDGLIHLTKEFR